MTKFHSFSIEKYYHIEKCIGQGTFSSVYEVRRLIDERKFALKRVFLMDIPEEKVRQDCLNEVNLLQNIEHPNIIRLIQYEYIHNEGSLNLVLELAALGDLHFFILSYARNISLVPESKVWKFTYQLCTALDYLHSRLMMHKDLKPANIFLTINEDVKIGDFGMAEMKTNCVEMLSDSVLGTPYYMSPERLLQKPYSFNCDVWSLGCVIYEIAALQSPFYVNKLDINFLTKRVITCDYPPLPSDKFSEELNNIIYKCLTADDKKRPNAKTILDLVQNICQSHATY